MAEPNDAELAARVRDHRRQERAGVERKLAAVPTCARGIVAVPAGVHPDHGEPVTFSPGELLPEWVAVLLAEQRPEADELGVYRLEAPKRRGER
jgi:hypothetical protein